MVKWLKSTQYIKCNKCKNISVHYYKIKTWFLYLLFTSFSLQFDLFDLFISCLLGFISESGTSLYIMSLCDDMLLCNYRKCRIKLSGYAWVTACSHIFCDQHGSGEFSRSPAICPACNSTLSGKLDIVRTELSPSEEYKAMVLAGLRPEIVLDISSRALAFWTYQVSA